MKPRNSNLVNVKAPAEHVTPASKKRVQQAGHHPEGIWFLPVYSVKYHDANLFTVAGCLVASAAEFMTVLCGGVS